MPVGRPRKYDTKEEAVKAKKRRRHQRTQLQRQSQAPAEFIAYEPRLHGDVPSETPPNLGLRISADIPVPHDYTVELNDELEDDAGYQLLFPDQPLPSVEEDAAVAEQISQLQDQEQQWYREQPDDEMEATYQADDTEALLSEMLPERQEELEAAECIGHNANITVPESTTHQSEAANSLPEEVLGLQTPSQQGERRSASRAETILSWFQPVVQRFSSIGSTARQEGPSNSHSTTPPIVEGTQPAASAAPSCHSPPTANPNGTASPRSTASHSGSPSVEPQERTAYKLAKQLRNFQGCTHEEHGEAEQLHQENHELPGAHSECSSLQEITRLIRGNSNGVTPIPDVLSNPKLMKPTDLPADIDLRGAFEGTSPAAFPQDTGTPDEALPRSLCLSQHHLSSPKNRTARVTFDIDSVCCFPSSLAFARQGINWLPKSHSFLNFSADVHFSLTINAYNNRGDLTTRNLPLHLVPHYCFGSAKGTDSLFIFIFFPELHLESQYEHSTYLSTEDQELWLDAVLLPALVTTVKESNLLQHYPGSAEIVRFAATALSGENFARKESAREQLLKYALQPEYLDLLWTCVLDRIAENPGFSRFSGATLFAHAKNTKLDHMTFGMTTAYERWERLWSTIADPQFYSKGRTYVDLGKQVTSEDTALPHDAIPSHHEAEVYLWKRCCLESYARTRIQLLADGKRAKGSPRHAVYPWAAMRDTMGQTLFSVPQGQENMDGLVYSQMYGLIKTPFDTSKTYVFNHDALENLALDPGYIRSLQQQGGGIAFSKSVCDFAYLQSKRRAHANLIDNRWKSYGIREEHRISLTMMDEICEQWRQWDLEDDGADNVPSPLPYYIVPTQDLLGFLYAQINKYCFLFEHTLALTARTVSLPETMVMVIALRALRFCYGSNMLQKESLLYKNRWEQTRGNHVLVKEGLGMQETMERCGLGWFLPKFNWTTRRLAQPHGDNILVGNLLMHAEYKRRWKSVKDLRDVFVRFNQAAGWYERYNIKQHPQLLEKWLEYLHVLAIDQFDADICKTMLAAHKRHPELSPAALERDGHIRFCHRGMRDMFLVDGIVGPPHFVTGNKMRFSKVGELLDFLFLWDDGKERVGWESKPYRVIIQKSFELVERRLGFRRANGWLDDFFQLIRLTHWVLPYPSDKAMIAPTKTSRSQGLTRRMSWFSAVFAHPDKVRLPFEAMPKTLYTLIWRAQRKIGRDPSLGQPWGTSELIKACRKQRIHVYGREEEIDYWIAGRKSASKKGFLPVWERSWVPELRMLTQIQDKNLDELDELMADFAQGVDSTGEDGLVESRNSRSGPSTGSTRLSIRDIFTQKKTGNSSKNGSQGRLNTDCQASSHGSVFLPSTTSE